MTLATIMIILALICFILDALPGVVVRYVNLTPLGLALLVGAILVARTQLG